MELALALSAASLAVSLVSLFLASKKEYQIADADLAASIMTQADRLDDLKVDVRLATQSADRAYTMASSANVAVAISQKQQVQAPDPEKVLKNELSQIQAEAVMMAETNPFLEPLLSDDQLDSLEKTREKRAKELKDALMNGAVK